jgi:ribonuclease Z
MRITFLGTAAARPTVGRNVSSLAIQREGELLLFDCGEGTQRQMMRFGTGFSVDDIFFSHLHADHFLGVIGLLLTMGLQGRETPMRLWVPAGTEAIMRTALGLGVDRMPFEVAINGVDAGVVVERDEYSMVAFRTQHRTISLGYAIVEKIRLGRFNPERAREMGIPEGPEWGKLHRGEPVAIGDRLVDASEVVGAARPGRTVVYTGDTRPCRETIEAARGADVLIHEATFSREEDERARQTGHSTARDAARIAKEAGVGRLFLTHLSPRYADDPRALEREARAVFRETVVAYDGLVVEVGYRDG